MTTGFHLVCGITESNGDLFRQRWYNPFNRMFGDPILRFHVRRLGAIRYTHIFYVRTCPYICVYSIIIFHSMSVLMYTYNIIYIPRVGEYL